MKSVSEILAISGILCCVLVNFSFAQNTQSQRGVSNAPHTESDQERLFIQRRYSTDYNQIPKDFAELVLTSTAYKIRISTGDTLPSIMLKYYNVGPDYSDAYAFLLRHIASINHLSEHPEIKPGSELLIPDIQPKFQGQVGSAKNPLPKLLISKTALSGSELAELGAKVISEYSEKVLVYEGQPGATDVIEIERVPISTARSLASDTPVGWKAINFPMQIQPAQSTRNAPNQDYSPLTSKETTFLQTQLKKKMLKHPVLFILDDGWPDADSFNTSKKFLTAAIKSVREHYKMGPSYFSQGLLDAKDVTLASNRPGIAASDAAATAAPHALQLKQSLMPLQKLESQTDRINVAYIPLYTREFGAAEVLQQLVEIKLDATYMRTNLGSLPVPDKIQAANRKIAEKIIANLTKLNYTPEFPDSDGAVTEAVLRFLNLYTQVAMQPFVLNMSWTLPNLQFPIYIPPVSFGLSVVAAGNEGDNVSDTQRQFAARSLSPGDMLAVMNVAPDGSATCKSSLLDADKDILGFSFPGELSAKDCGSSFSSSRVAWLIAAREAITPWHESQTPWNRFVSDWQYRTIKNLKEVRSESAKDKSQKQFNKIRLNVFSLFSRVPN